MPKRVVVGAHYGWRDWLVQRVTAVVMALYTLLMLGLLAVARRPRLRRVEGDCSRSDAFRARLVRLHARRCCGTRGSACATSRWTT